MGNFLGIKNIFPKVFIGITALFLVDILLLVVIGKETDGVVVEYYDNNGGGFQYPSIKYPIVGFTANGKTHTFHGNWDSVFSQGDTVKVVYRPWWPYRASIKSFWQITRKPLMQLALAYLVWYMVYSSFYPTVNRKRGGRGTGL